MAHFPLSDQQIIDGLRDGNSRIFRDYFYEYCRAAYHLYDQQYSLSQKPNLDFMSLAHQYALYLMEHQWRPLEDRSPNVSLRTWIIGGFRFTVLDALKWYQKEYGNQTYEDYLRTFDTNRDLRLQFNHAIEDICNHYIGDRFDRLVLEFLLVQGFKTKEVAEKLGVTPSAISQRYNHLKKDVLSPYFRQYFDMEFDMPEVLDELTMPIECQKKEPNSLSAAPKKFSKGLFSFMQNNDTSAAYDETSVVCADTSVAYDETSTPFTLYNNMEKKRTTPNFIESLEPNEVFVFGSNLRGMHGGGAAWIAYKKFGAIMGQGVGLQGQSYAIPTMQGGVETIRPYVDEFIAFAKAHPELTFLVTRIGCGIAGFTDEEIAPLFEQAHPLDNIALPAGW